MARKYTRDNRGRFASTGSGATARGGRLKTASGNKRQTQTMQAKGSGSKLRNRNTTQLQIAASKGDRSAFAALDAQRKGPLKPARTDTKDQGWGTGLNQGGAPKRAFAKAPAGTIGKPKGLKPGAIQARAAAKPAASNKVSASPRQLNSNERIARDVMSDKRFRSDRQRVAEMVRRGIKPGTDVVGLVADLRAKQGGGTTGRIKPAVKRKAVGSITTAKADRIIARIDANRPGQRRVAGSLRKSQNASRTHQRATEFALGAAKRSIRRGKPIGATESVRRAVANAAKKRRR